MKPTMQKISVEIESLNGALFMKASVLHRILKIHEPFNLWISKRIREWGYAENSDYKKVVLKERVDETICNMTEYYVSVSMAAELSITEKSEEGIEAAKTFRNILNSLKQPFSNKYFQKDFIDMIHENNETVQLCPF